MKIAFTTLALLLCLLPAEAQNNEAAQVTEVHNLDLCDLFRNPEFYDEKEVRFRAVYHSEFEVSSFSVMDCSGDNNYTWVEFDRESVQAAAKADILQKMADEVGWGGGDALYFRETEMLVRGIFHGVDKGYGQDNLWRFMVTVKNVEELGATKKVKIPGLWPVD